MPNNKPTNPRTVNQDFFDSVKSAIEGVKNGFSNYKNEYEHLREQLYRLPKGSPLSREIHNLNENIKMHLNFADSLRKKAVADHYVSSIEKKEKDYVHKVWDAKNYKAQASDLGKLLSDVIGEFFLQMKKKPTPAEYAKYYPAFSLYHRGADMLDVVTAINDILKNDKHVVLVNLLQKKLAAKFIDSEELQASPLRFEKSGSHKPLIVFDLKLATANIHKESFKDREDFPYRLAETAVEIGNRILLRDLKDKIKEYKAELSKKAEKLETIESLDKFIDQIRATYKVKIEQDLLFGIYFKDLKEQRDVLQKPGLTENEYAQCLKNIAGLQGKIKESLVGEHERVVKSLYGKAKNMLIEYDKLTKNDPKLLEEQSPNFRGSIGKMLTYVTHVDAGNLPEENRPSHAAKLLVLAEDSRRYFIQSPRKMDHQVKDKLSFGMLLQNALVHLMDTLSLITKNFVGDSKKMQVIDKKIDKIEFPDIVKPKFLTDVTNTSTVRPHRLPEQTGAIFKRKR